MKELICIVCPKGCHLSVDENNGYSVTGNGCVRGAEYGKKELINPERTVTSTVIIENAMLSRCPVKTDKPIPKDKMFKVMDALNGIVVSSPIKCGDIIIKNVADTGANIVSTKNM